MKDRSKNFHMYTKFSKYFQILQINDPQASNNLKITTYIYLGVFCIFFLIVQITDIIIQLDRVFNLSKLGHAT